MTFSIFDSMITISPEKGTFSLLTAGKRKIIIIEQIDSLIQIPSADNLSHTIKTFEFKKAVARKEENIDVHDLERLDDFAIPITGKVESRAIVVETPRNMRQTVNQFLNIMGLSSTQTWLLPNETLKDLLAFLLEQESNPPPFVSINFKGNKQALPPNAFTLEQWIRTILNRVEITLPPEGDPVFMPQLFPSRIGPDVGKNNRTRTFIEAILEKKSVEEIERLIAAGADVNCSAPTLISFTSLNPFKGMWYPPEEVSGKTPLMLVASQGNLNLAKLLVSKGAELDTSLEIGDAEYTAMDWAIKGNHPELVFFFYSLDARHYIPLQKSPEVKAITGKIRERELEAAQRAERGEQRAFDQGRQLGAHQAPIATVQLIAQTPTVTTVRETPSDTLGDDRGSSAYPT